VRTRYATEVPRAVGPSKLLVRVESTLDGGDAGIRGRRAAGLMLSEFDCFNINTGR